MLSPARPLHPVCITSDIYKVRAGWQDGRMAPLACCPHGWVGTARRGVDTVLEPMEVKISTEDRADVGQEPERVEHW